MENHPIPQDVTGFKFKIIGSMTVKQFGYIIAAGIFCTITFVLPLEGIAAIIKIPLMAMFAGVGFALAFVPVGGRPLDKMLVYFAASIPKENQFVYHKQGVDLAQYEFLKPTIKVTQPAAAAAQAPKNDVKRTALASALRNSYFRPDDEEMQYFAGIKASFDSADSKVTAAAPSVSKSPGVTLPKASPSTPAPVANDTTTPTITVANPIVKEREVINPIKPAAPAPQPAPVAAAPVAAAPAPVVQPAKNEDNEVAEITKEIQEVKTAEQSVGQTAELEQKIRELEQKLAQALGETAQYQNKILQQEKQTAQSQVVTPTEKQAQPAQNVKTVTSKTSLSSGFPTIPDVPNIVLGIVKDPRGKVLQNILVEVVDTNEIPVRAFKTNALGQFISATPLPNGTFKMYFDDPGKHHEFETVEIEMKGEIFNPIEITSVDQREKLRRDLFGPGPTAPIPQGSVPGMAI